MKVQNHFLVIVLVVSSATCVPRAFAVDGAGVTAANGRFYAALNELFTGKADAMKEVWSHADDIIYMGPMGGAMTGWAHIEKVWDEQAAMKLGGKVEPTGVHVVASSEISVVTDTETGENTNAHGEHQMVSIRATNTYRLEGGKWRMIGHHTDLLPKMVK